MEDKTNQGIFINGKAQIIDMLKYMQEDERTTLLKNIQARNPQLAKELYAESISFGTIYSLDQVDLGALASYIKAEIMGVALKGAKPEFQRKLLSSVPRPYAEVAFTYINKNLGANEDRDVGRAQKRVSDTIVALNNKGRISL